MHLYFYMTYENNKVLEGKQIASWNYEKPILIALYGNKNQNSLYLSQRWQAQPFFIIHTTYSISKIKLFDVKALK